MMRTSARAGDDPQPGLNGRPQPVTSYDVARLAGVTQPTVSRAMRGDRVAESTRLRVLAAAQALGYVPSDAGRSLATRRSKRIGIAVSDLRDAFYPWLIAPFEEALAESQLQIVLFRDLGDDAALVGQLASSGVDGVALTSATIHSRQPEMLAKRGIPTVLLNRGVDDYPVDTCVSDNVRGSALVAERLLQLGHRRIAGVFGPANTSTGRDRARGFRDALASADVALHPDVVREVPYSYQTGHDALVDILRSRRPPTAVFLANDLLAIGALNAAKRFGISVPGDLTIVGYGNMEMAEWELFDLTTVRQDVVSMSRSAAALLIARIERPTREPQRILIAPSLVLRSTDGPPNS